MSSATNWRPEDGPEQVLFQSWHDHPDHALPETEPYTFTGFIMRYFGDRASLGFRTGGRGANLAFGKATRVSRQHQGYGGEYAVDGDSGTLWNSGDFAPQWIEIDLGSPHEIQGIQLITSQSPVGETEHRVLGRGPGATDAFVLLHTFAGPTADSQTLSVAPDVPWPSVQYIRVQTVRSPSWVAWREIRILDAGEN